MILTLTLAAAIAAAQPSTAGETPDPDPAGDLAALQQLYDTSCGNRGYGAYDDVCIQLSEQLRQAEQALRRRPRRPAAIKAPAPSAPAARASLPPSHPFESTPPTAPGPSPAAGERGGATASVPTDASSSPTTSPP